MLQQVVTKCDCEFDKPFEFAVQFSVAWGKGFKSRMVSESPAFWQRCGFGSAAGGCCFQALTKEAVHSGYRLHGSLIREREMPSKTTASPSKLRSFSTSASSSERSWLNTFQHLSQLFYWKSRARRSAAASPVGRHRALPWDYRELACTCVSASSESHFWITFSQQAPNPSFFVTMCNFWNSLRFRLINHLWCGFTSLVS